MRAALAALVLLAGCAGLAPPDWKDPAACATLFARYDQAAWLYSPNAIDLDGGGSVPSGPLVRPAQELRQAGCLTTLADLQGMPELAARLQPFAIENSGAEIRPKPVHVGIVTGIEAERQATIFFRGLGYRSRGIGAEGLGRRIYIGPFTTQGAVDQAIAVAREAGFIAPFAAEHTRF